MQAEIVQTKTLNLIIDSVIMFLSLFFILSTIIELKKNKKLRNIFIKIFLCELIYALFHLLAVYFKGMQGDFAYFIVRLANFMEYSFIFVVFIFFVDYIFFDVESKNKKILKIGMLCFSLCAILINIINIFVPFIYSINEQNIYQREQLFYLPSILMFINCLAIFVIIIFNRKYYSTRILISFLSGVFFPIAGAIIQSFIYGYSFVIIGVFLSSVFIFFTMLINETQKAKEKEKELIQLNNKITLNQKNPHFLFNALSSIMYLCDKDMAEAKEALHDFALYLRNNLDSIASYELIPFKKELEHIETYLRIENRRFSNKIVMIKDIEYSDFSIPPLSLETLIENSVKHGLFNKEKGTIILRTRKFEDNFVIKIIDDGVGFDVDNFLENKDKEKDPDERVSYGLTSSMKRLKYYLNANFQINSIINEGTEITITIPLANKKDERKKK